MAFNNLYFVSSFHHVYFADTDNRDKCFVDLFNKESESKHSHKMKLNKKYLIKSQKEVCLN